jgi:methionyl-tRNA formyltransferase
MTPRIDAGGIILTEATVIDPDETAGELEERLAKLGAPLVTRVVDSLQEGPIPVLPQDAGKVTKAPKLRKDDGLIDWSRPAQAIHNLVRAMQPWPAASTWWRPGAAQARAPVRLIVHRTKLAGGQGRPGEVIEASGDRLVVSGGDGGVALMLIQLPGKRPSTPADFLRGYRIVPGDMMVQTEHL